MNRLILMRHARAEAAPAGAGDRERPLSPGGRADAALMARALAERGARPDLALVSSALRTRQTWEAVADQAGDVDLRLEPALYDAGADTLRRFVEANEETAGCLLVLAHNPGIHALAIDYLIEAAASPSAADKLASGFPPGAACLFSVDVAGRPTYEGFITPADLGGGHEA